MDSRLKKYPNTGVKVLMTVGMFLLFIMAIISIFSTCYALGQGYYTLTENDIHSVVNHDITQHKVVEIFDEYIDVTLLSKNPNKCSTDYKGRTNFRFVIINHQTGISFGNYDENAVYDESASYEAVYTDFFNKEYTVRGYLLQNRPVKEFWEVYNLAGFCIHILYSIRMIVPILAVLSLLMFIVLYVKLLRSAGHHNGKTEITAGRFDRFQFDILTILLFLIPSGIIYLLKETGIIPLLEYLLSAAYGDVVVYVLEIFLLILVEFVPLYLFSHTLAVRLKLGQFWKNTFLYRNFSLLCSLPGRYLRSIKGAGKYDTEGKLLPQWYDKIPLEIVAAVLLVLPFPLYIGIHDVLRYTFLWTILFDWTITALAFVLAAVVTLLWLFAYTVSVRIKCGTLWTNTLTYRLGKLLKFLFRHLNHAGKRNESGELVPMWFDRIPLEIVLLAAFLLAVLVLYIADGLIYAIPADFVTYLFLLLGWGTLLYGLAYLISIRLQLGTLWTNTLVYRISRKCSGLYPHICRSIPLTWRTGLAVVLYCIFTFLIFAFTVDPWEIVPALLIWFALTWAAGTLLIYSSWATHTITQVIRDMANGNIHKKTDPSKLFFIFRKQAEGLNSLGDGLQAAVQAQMKSERFKTELITNVSHDIKTPLTSIINYSDLLLAELGHEIQPDGKAAEYANTIYRHSLRLKKLTEDLVEASKASSGAITVNFERIELNQMLRQAVGEYEERLLRAQLTPVCRFTEEDVFITADGRLLWRVFDNLCSNIVKYSLPGTRVYITLTQNGDRAIVSFQNISRDTLNVDTEDLLERFVRGDASRHSEGSGLGLNIALSLCDRMNGRLTLACDGDLFRADVEFEILK